MRQTEIDKISAALDRAEFAFEQLRKKVIEVYRKRTSAKTTEEIWRIWNRRTLATATKDPVITRNPACRQAGLDANNERRAKHRSARRIGSLPTLTAHRSPAGTAARPGLKDANADAWCGQEGLILLK